VSTPDVVTAHDVPVTLAQHLALWAGAWPPRVPLHIVANPRAAQPRWDGALSPVTGVQTETGWAVLGVDPSFEPAVSSAIRSGATQDGATQDGDDPLPGLLAALPTLLDRPGIGVRGTFRWTTDPAPLPDAGIWLPVDDPRVPPWLQPFGGEVLVTLEDDVYIAGVGIKRHDAHGQELAVVTDERARGRGLARRLVAQAARRVLDEGAVPTYLHAPDNVASARVAEASGFTDRGWKVLGFFPAH
jgi:GNAT superfamily N-acetyltransferase